MLKLHISIFCLFLTFLPPGICAEKAFAEVLADVSVHNDFDQWMNLLGPWQFNVSALNSKFLQAEPFPHVVIDNFLDPALAEVLEHDFPPLSHPSWHKYNNPIEIKYAMDDCPKLYESLFDFLRSEPFLNLARGVSGIQEAQPDPFLHGAGLHFHPRGGKLDMHLDYSIHPKTGMERRLNFILFLNKGWDPAWGGALELWDADFQGPKAKVVPSFNRGVFFQTSDTSFHGLPTPLTCPISQGRKSLAIYYVSDPRPGASPRPKAEFRPLPWQPVPPGLAALYEIRKDRVITEEDLAREFPDWKESEHRQNFW